MEVRMAQDNDGMAKGLVVGFIAGTIAGAVLALLYAPTTGKELRDELRVKAKDVADNADEYVARAKAKAVEIVNEGKTRSDTLLNEAKSQAASIMGDAKRILSEARNKGNQEASKNS